MTNVRPRLALIAGAALLAGGAGRGIPMAGTAPGRHAHRLRLHALRRPRGPHRRGPRPNPAGRPERPRPRAVRQLPRTRALRRGPGKWPRGRTRRTLMAQHRDSSRQVVVAVPAQGAGVRACRCFAVDVLRRWGLPSQQLDAAVLVVDELATNAMQHGHADMTLLLSLGRQFFLIGVADSGEGVPHRRLASTRMSTAGACTSWPHWRSGPKSTTALKATRSSRHCPYRPRSEPAVGRDV
ncbi:ATP-binding protein [Streptomyces sp. NPDC055092]